MSDPDEVIETVLADVWARNRDGLVAALDRVRTGLDRLAAGTLADDERAGLGGDLHRLKGGMGTLGRPEGSALAEEAERVLASGDGVAAAGLATEVAAYIDTIRA